MTAKKKAPKKRGRKGGIKFLTPDKQKRFFHAINNNCTIRAACALAGMAPATFHKYQEQHRVGTAEPKRLLAKLVKLATDSEPDEVP